MHAITALLLACVAAHVSAQGSARQEVLNNKCFRILSKVDQKQTSAILNDCGRSATALQNNPRVSKDLIRKLVTLCFAKRLNFVSADGKTVNKGFIIQKIQEVPDSALSQGQKQQLINNINDPSRCRDFDSCLLSNC